MKTWAKCLCNIESLSCLYFIAIKGSNILTIFLKVLRTPDFRNCKVATEIRQGTNLKISFVVNLYLNVFSEIQV